MKLCGIYKIHNKSNNNINTRHRWKHLTTDFIKNIRKESKGE